MGWLKLVLIPKYAVFGIGNSGFRKTIAVILRP